MRALTTHPHTTHTHARAANAELGQMTQMSSFFVLSSNSLSSAIPTQLGKLIQMTSGFYLYSNALSLAIPTGGCMRAHTRAA